MIIGDYPCCGEVFCVNVPEVTPVMQKETCPHCGAVVWHKLSRWDPKSWTEEGFLEEYDVDEETRGVTPKNISPANPELDALVAEHMKTVSKQLADEIASMLLYGEEGDVAMDPKYIDRMVEEQTRRNEAAKKARRGQQNDNFKSSVGETA